MKRLKASASAQKSACRLVLILAGVQAVVAAAAGHELFMRPLLDDLAVVNDEDEVCIAHGRETVRDDYRGAAMDYRVDGRLYLLLRYRVDRGCRLVENEDARIREDRAGE